MQSVARKMIVMAMAWFAWLAFPGCSGNQVGVDAGDGVDGVDAGEIECPEPELHEEYCINPLGYECDRLGSFCRDGKWTCRTGREHPPPMPEFEDWAWRCEVYQCFAQHIPFGEGTLQPGWQEPGPYVPPDPASLTGRWRMVADSDSLVPYGCERQPRQYAAANSLAVDPHNPDVMYVGLVVDEWMGIHWVSGVFKSVDGGQTWFEARTMLGNQSCVFVTGHGPAVAGLYMDPGDPQVLYASMIDCGLYRTRDGANRWEEVWHFFDCGTPGPVGWDGARRRWVD